MAANWETVTDDELSAKVSDTFESLVEAMVEYGAGEVTATPKDREGRALGIVSVAEIGGRYIGVYIDLQGKDSETVWAYRV